MVSEHEPQYVQVAFQACIRNSVARRTSTVIVLGTSDAILWILCLVLGPSLQDGHWGARSVQRMATKLVKGLEHKSCDKQLRDLWVFTPTKKRIMWDLIAPYNHMNTGCIKVRVCLFCQITSKRTRRNGIKLHQRTVLSFQICLWWEKINAVINRKHF